MGSCHCLRIGLNTCRVPGREVSASRCVWGAGAEAKLRQLALRMNRSTLLAERRSRFLQAIRQTYNDFFHDYFVNSGQIFLLRVRAQPL